MVELFSSYKARENYTQTISEIIFDEAIINPKTGEEYLEDEAGKIKELIGSAWRDRINDPQPKLIYIANPYERFRPFMANFLPLIRKDLNKLKKRVFANEIVNLENEQGELLSLFKPTPCQKEQECKCIDENCVEVEEDLKITEFINGSLPKYIFQGCILYQAKKGFLFFAHKENKEISNREEIKSIPE
ncbi:16965_t:CDS:2 [Gigaspora margarita]|uniref:16965_t:CDS:1 n=1 Tax=Gigaspora margarita TaxID=4874 RepID=A0ABM8VW41_GIGMA|nr:16965_t:CDS:2 [Gigaspora margarita]